MPYKSDAQRKYFNANRDKIGNNVVDEFNVASKGQKMPKKVKKPMSKSKMKSAVASKLSQVMSKTGKY